MATHVKGQGAIPNHSNEGVTPCPGLYLHETNLPCYLVHVGSL